MVNSFIYLTIFWDKCSFIDNLEEIYAHLYRFIDIHGSSLRMRSLLGDSSISITKDIHINI